MNATHLTASDRKNYFQRCKFCGEQVNLSTEGVTYRDDSAAHEECDDAQKFASANDSDFRD